MWIANYSGTPLQSTRNRTHMGLSVAPASVDRRAGSTCVVSRRPPRPACPLGYESPPCRTSWTGPVLAVPTASPPSGPPRPPHTRPLPSAGLRCRLCESVHSPALPCPGGAGGLCPPPRVQGPLSPLPPPRPASALLLERSLQHLSGTHLGCQERPGTYSSVRGAACSFELQGDFVNLYARTCDLWHAGHCTWDAWICLWGLISDAARSKPASLVTPKMGPATRRCLL